MSDRLGIVIELVGDLLDAGVAFDAAVDAVDAAGCLDPVLLRAAFDRTAQFEGCLEADQMGSLLAGLYVRARTRRAT